MLEQPPETNGLNVRKTRGSPEKKVSFNFSQSIKGTIYSLLGNKMQTTPNARNSCSLNGVNGQPSGKKTEAPTPVRRQRSSDAANREIAALQPLTLEGQKPVWRAGNTRILSQNLDSILRAAQQTPERRSPTAPIIPNAVNTSTGSPTKKGKKRSRPDDGGDPDDPDDNNNNGNGSAAPRPKKHRETRCSTTPALAECPAYAELTELTKEPIAPLPLSSIVQVQPRVDLATLAPQPLRISYKPHPLEDRSDAWFTEMFRRLFRQSDRFATHYFAVHNLEAGQFFEPWAAGMTDEFITWAEQVAEPDANHVDYWDEILRNTVQRKWLVMAILMKIIKVKIFDADMFGTGKEQAELLHGISRALLGREGKHSFSSSLDT
jgi:hypothetical protein